MPKHNPLLDELHAAMAAHPKNLPLNDKGQLVPDPIPMAPPIGYSKQPSMAELIRAQVLQVSRDAAREGLETEEQADDFDVGDEPEIRSPYELDAESEVPISVLKHRADEAALNYMEAKREAGLRMQKDAAAGTAPPQSQPSSEVPKADDKPPEGVGGGSRHSA